MQTSMHELQEYRYYYFCPARQLLDVEVAKLNLRGGWKIDIPLFILT